MWTERRGEEGHRVRVCEKRGGVRRGTGRGSVDRGAG